MLGCDVVFFFTDGSKLRDYQIYMIFAVFGLLALYIAVVLIQRAGR